ncbi:MAG: hypothetical protein WA432_01425 [Candidatus Babeliaceae bacterium]
MDIKKLLLFFALFSGLKQLFGMDIMGSELADFTRAKEESSRLYEQSQREQEEFQKRLAQAVQLSNLEQEAQRAQRVQDPEYFKYQKELNKTYKENNIKDCLARHGADHNLFKCAQPYLREINDSDGSLAVAEIKVAPQETNTNPCGYHAMRNTGIIHRACINRNSAMLAKLYDENHIKKYISTDLDRQENPNYGLWRQAIATLRKNNSTDLLRGDEIRYLYKNGSKNAPLIVEDLAAFNPQIIDILGGKENCVATFPYVPHISQIAQWIQNPQSTFIQKVILGSMDSLKGRDGGHWLSVNLAKLPGEKAQMLVGSSLGHEHEANDLSLIRDIDYVQDFKNALLNFDRNKEFIPTQERGPLRADLLKQYQCPGLAITLNFCNKDQSKASSSQSKKE